MCRIFTKLLRIIMVQTVVVAFFQEKQYNVYSENHMFENCIGILLLTLTSIVARLAKAAGGAARFSPAVL